MVVRRIMIALILFAAIATGRGINDPAYSQEVRQQTDPPQQTAGGVKPADPKFRAVRSVSGTKGVELEGRFVIEDPRTLFYIPDDKQVIVYFEWEGPLGAHNFEALWKNPEGKVVMISNFSFRAEHERFAGYYTMLLGPTVTTGVWMAEARIDGEAAGTHAFQIVAAPRPADAITTRRILSRADLYQRAARSSVFVENLGRTGERQTLGSGFFIGEGQILTAFQVIEGANLLRITTPDGGRIETRDVLASNRRQDWAILKVDAAKSAVLERAAPDSLAIGDRCYSLDVPADGNKVIVEGNLIGRHTPAEAGERLNLSFHVGSRAIGSPVLNEYGELIGMIGGSLIPGTSFMEDMGLPNPIYRLRLGNADQRALALPMSLIAKPSPGGQSSTLEEIARSGQFVPPLVGYRNVSSAALARSVERRYDMLQAVDEKHEYSRRDGQAVLLLTWYPKEKRKGTPSLRIYDLDNRPLGESAGKKVTLNPNKLSFSTWQLGLASLPVGIYRIDILLDADPVWRLYFRIVD